MQVCDFGMARKFGDPTRPYTHNVRARRQQQQRLRVSS